MTEAKLKIDEIQKYIESKINNIEFSSSLHAKDGNELTLRFKFHDCFSLAEIPIEFIENNQATNEYLDFVIHEAVENLGYLYFLKESR